MRAAVRDYRRDGFLIRSGGECERLLLEASDLLGRPFLRDEITASLDEILREVGETLAPAPTPSASRDDYPNCFTGGMRVLTPGGERPIAELHEGDFVYSFDFESQALVPNRIETISTSDDYPFGRLPDLARPIEVTPRHRFLSHAGRGEIDFVPIGDLEPQNLLFSRDEKGGGLVPTPRGVYRPECGRSTVRDLRLMKPPHNYFIEGILVHNGIKVWA